MTTAFEDRILNERARLRGDEAALRKRVAEFAHGPKAKEILDLTLKYESTGHLDFSLFNCPPVIDHGVGARLYDVDENEYIDLHGGFTVNALGYGVTEINEAVKSQMDKLCQYAELPVEPRARLAKELCQRHPGDFDKKIFWAVTGGEAIEIIMKLARWYTGKPILITHWGDYHGRTAGAMALTSKAFMVAYSYPIPPADTAVVRIPFPYCYRCPFGKAYPSCEMFCAREVGRLFESKETWLNNPKAQVTNVAAFIIEPFQSSAGYITAPLEYMRMLKDLSEKYDFLFVSDEVQAGMGRTGKMWSIEHSGVAPDLIAMAKSISNGLPISAVTGRKEIMDSWGPGAHSSTFTGYPPACAGGLKLFEIYERENIIQGAAEKGAYFLEGLKDLQARHPLIGDVNGMGLYLAIELVKDRQTKEPAAEASHFAANELVNEGVICIYSGYYFNRLCFAPPLVITKGDIAEALKRLDVVLGKAEAKFGIGK
ncbi:MAG: aspartate aminotransferase family protein [Anaerolineae bacterium]|nr:aspartate aminotransferase family protein [Anaerolineae bacterium]